MKRKLARTFMFEFARFARANRREAKNNPALRDYFRVAEREYVRIALGYRMAARVPEDFDVVNFKLVLKRFPTSWP